MEQRLKFMNSEPQQNKKVRNRTMTINLSAEMVYALYCAAKSCEDVTYHTKELLDEFADMVEDYADTNIDRVLTERMKELR